MKYQIREWLINHKREIVFFILIFLVSTISFGLGYLVASDTNRAPIIIQKNSQIGD